MKTRNLLLLLAVAGASLMSCRQGLRPDVNELSENSDVALKDAYADAFKMGCAINTGIAFGRNARANEIVRLAFKYASEYAPGTELYYNDFNVWRPDKRDKIDRVTVWGVDDGMSWKNGSPIPNRTNYPLLWNRDLTPKPALQAILEIPSKQVLK